MAQENLLCVQKLEWETSDLLEFHRDWWPVTEGGGLALVGGLKGVGFALGFHSSFDTVRSPCQCWLTSSMGSLKQAPV